MDQYKFPEIKPNLKEDKHGWFSDKNSDFIKPYLTENIKVIVEVGSWLGKSTRWLCENSNAKVYSIDTWTGSTEHQENIKVNTKLTTLYDTFIVNCWEFRDRIVPMKLESRVGLPLLADNDIIPDLIYLDGSHEYGDVLVDLKLSYKLFPNAIIIGDDYNWRNKRLNNRKTVMEAVDTFCLETGCTVIDNHQTFKIERKHGN